MTRAEMQAAVDACKDARWQNVTVPAADLAWVLNRLGEAEKLATEIVGARQFAFSEAGRKCWVDELWREVDVEKKEDRLVALLTEKH